MCISSRFVSFAEPVTFIVDRPPAAVYEEPPPSPPPYEGPCLVCGSQGQARVCSQNGIMACIPCGVGIRNVQGVTLKVRAILVITVLNFSNICWTRMASLALRRISFWQFDVQSLMFSSIEGCPVA